MPVPARNGPIPHCIAARRIDPVKDSAGERGSWAHLRLRLLLWDKVPLCNVCAVRRRALGFAYIRSALTLVGGESIYLISCLSQTASSVLSVCLHYRDRLCGLFFSSPMRLDRQDPFVCLSFHLRRYEASQSSSQPISFWTLLFNLHSILKQPRCTSQY